MSYIIIDCVQVPTVYTITGSSKWSWKQ